MRPAGGGNEKEKREDQTNRREGDRQFTIYKTIRLILDSDVINYDNVLSVHL